MPRDRIPVLARKTGAPGEPAVIRRLPAEVEYTFVKMIILDVPSVLTTLSWIETESDGSPWAWFHTKSYRAIDRKLQRLEQSLPADPQVAERQTFRAVRSEFVRQVLGVIDLEAGRTKRWISARPFDPSRLAERYRPPGSQRPTLVMSVWRQSRTGPVLLVERTLPSGPPPFGDARVAWFDPDQFDETCRALFRRYFPEALRMTAGQHWRTNRAPVGWPLIVQFVVPRLYDYLRPYYRVRGYRRGLARPSAGHYPLQLRGDICDLVRLELPHLAQGLTLARVTAAIQRHVAAAPKDRPMGRAMFALGGSAPENPVT